MELGRECRLFGYGEVVKGVSVARSPCPGVAMALVLFTAEV